MKFIIGNYEIEWDERSAMGIVMSSSFRLHILAVHSTLCYSTINMVAHDRVYDKLSR